jgi:hypothetical protein
MAFYTIPLHHHLMTALGIFGDNVFVTLITNFVRIFIQQLSMGSGMRVMAFRTLSRFYRGMDKWIFELFFKIVVAAQTELPFASGFNLNLFCP